MIRLVLRAQHTKNLANGTTDPFRDLLLVEAAGLRGKCFDQIQPLVEGRRARAHNDLLATHPGCLAILTQKLKRELALAHGQAAGPARSWARPIYANNAAARTAIISNNDLILFPVFGSRPPKSKRPFAGTEEQLKIAS